MRFYLHADLDAFFASAEIARNPSLQGRPLVVGSEPYRDRYRGVALTATYEAREYGIHSGMSIAECYRRCPTLLYVEPHYSYYQELSRKVMDILSQMFPALVQASVDEAYMVAEDELEGVIKRAEELKRRVEEEMGLKVTVGGGASPLTAKICSSMAKPDGLLIVPPGEEKDLLWEAPISAVPGIGQKAQVRLLKEGVETVGDLYMLGRGRAFELASEAALRVLAILDGSVTDAGNLLNSGPRQSYSRQKRWFPPDGVEPREEECVGVWCEVLDGIAGDLMEEMVGEGAIPGHISLSFRWRGGVVSRGFKLPAPIWEGERIKRLAKELFLREMRKRGVNARDVRAISLRLGVGRRIGKGQRRLEDFTSPQASSASPRREAS